MKYNYIALGRVGRPLADVTLEYEYIIIIRRGGGS